MLVCVVTLLLSALSLTTAEAKANSSGSPTFRHLNSVAAVSASDVWAVGNFSKSNNSFQTLIEPCSPTTRVPPSFAPLRRGEQGRAYRKRCFITSLRTTCARQ